MTVGMDDDADDLADFALPPDVKEPNEDLPPREFLPWHKPRKQWVREHVLLRYVRDLIPSLNIPPDSRFFRYLSLPGDDLLDIRVLAPMIHRRNLQMHYIGFNSVGKGSRREIHLNLAENDLKARPEIYRDSTVYRDRLETIGHAGMQFERVSRVGPFHAINIDLCDHVGQHPGKPTYIDAIGKIIELQTLRARDPWVLFLATCIHPDQIHADNLAAFIQAINNNIAESKEFGTALTDFLMVEGVGLKNALDNVGRMERDQFRKFFLIGFGKWLLQYLATAIPKGRLSLLRACHYSVTDEDVDMLTLAFRCDPVVAPAVDRTGLIAGAAEAPAAAYDEVKAALELIGKGADILSIDEILENKPDLYHRCMDETLKLLQLAHYPVENYENWLREKDTLGHLLPA